MHSWRAQTSTDFIFVVFHYETKKKQQQTTKMQRKNNICGQGLRRIVIDKIYSSTLLLYKLLT